MKDHVVFVRVSESDFQAINDAAHDARQTPGPWARSILLKYVHDLASARREEIVESQRAAGFVNTTPKQSKAQRGKRQRRAPGGVAAKLSRRAKDGKPKRKKKADKPRVKRGKPAKRARPPSRRAKPARKRR